MNRYNMILCTGTPTDPLNGPNISQNTPQKEVAGFSYGKMSQDGSLTHWPTNFDLNQCIDSHPKTRHRSKALMKGLAREHWFHGLGPPRVHRFHSINKHGTNRPITTPPANNPNAPLRLGA